MAVVRVLLLVAGRASSLGASRSRRNANLAMARAPAVVAATSAGAAAARPVVPDGLLRELLLVLLVLPLRGCLAGPSSAAASAPLRALRLQSNGLQPRRGPNVRVLGQVPAGALLPRWRRRALLAGRRRPLA